MKKYIYIQRHGESETNIKKIFTCRKIDPSLSENGREQIINKIKYYQDKNIQRIISSPSKRAVETAEILSEKLKINYTIDENLYEVDVGDLEGKSELDDKNINYFFEILNNWMNKNVNLYFPNGENYTNIRNRINNLMDKYFSIDENIILIGHSAFFSMLLFQFKKVNNIKELFLKRGGAVKIDKLKNEIEFIN